MGRPPKLTNDTWKNAKSEMPAMPIGLPPDAEDEWRRLSPFLLAVGRVSAVDKQALVTYCLAWNQFARILRDEFSEPWAKLYADGPKCDVIHPAFPPLIRYADSLYRMAGQFGITARTRELENDHGNRKSNSLKALMGNQRKVAESKLKSSVIPLLPDWQSQDTACPDWMPSRAMAEYYEIAKGLSGLDLFTPLDRTPLVVGCCLYELLLRSVEQMKDLFTEVTKMEQVNEEEWEERTYQKEHPLHLVQSQLMGILHKLWKDYGMTPRYRRIFNGEQKKEKAVPFEFKPKVVG